LGQALIVWEKGQAARLTGFADKLLWAERQAQARLAPQISALQAELEKTFAVAFDYTLLGALQQVGVSVGATLSANTLLTMKLSQVAPILPYLFLVLILIFRPKGLLGNREG
jgi:branched-subunit amino acid ABC-type transport system permease component